METLRTLALAGALALAAGPAAASVLYKSIGPTGVVQFSDVPPDDASRLVEQRSLPSSDGSSSTLAMNVLPLADEAIVRASAQVDLAEHALALARRSLWSQVDGLHLATHRRSASDAERVDFYKKGVVAARQNLLEILRLRSAPKTVIASR